MTPWGGRRAQAATRWTINRDRGICWICGHPGADTLDHIKPRSTHPDLAWEPTNWKAAHGAARPEYACPGQYARGNYPGPRRPGTTPDPSRLHVIVGPPCAGKTTHVEQHRQPTDLVIDLDAIAVALGSPTSHHHHPTHTRAARAARTAVIDQALTDKNTPAWIIDTTPRTEDTPRYDRAHATVTLLDPGRAACLNRAKQRPNTKATTAAILNWYKHDAKRLREWVSEQAPPPPTSGARQW